MQQPEGVEQLPDPLADEGEQAVVAAAQQHTPLQEDWKVWRKCGGGMEGELRAGGSGGNAAAPCKVPPWGAFNLHP